jgi:hypothetical protein
LTRGGRGGGRVKKIFFQNFCLYYFGGHAKFQIPTICPYWGLATAATRKQQEEEDKKKKNMQNSGLRLSDTVCTAPLGPKEKYTK